MIGEDQLRQFHELGYFVTEPMFSQVQLKEMAAEFDRVHGDQIERAEADTDADPARVELVRSRPFIGQFHTRSETAARFIKAPIYLEACAKLLGPDADLYFNQAVIKPPEKGKPFAWHQDSGYVATEPLEYITCWTAISRTFVANGCIWVIPGSHKWGVLDHPRNEADQTLHAQFDDDSGAIAVEMQPGQVAIFSSLMLHRNGPNTSDQIRRGYVPQYHHPGVIAVRDGKPFGDRLPVLRDGKPV